MERSETYRRAVEEFRYAWPNRGEPGARHFLRMLVGIMRRTRTDLHKHQCGFLDQEEFERTGLAPQDGCGFVWEHDGSRIDSQESNLRAHTCPRCGQGPWFMKYNKFTTRWALPGIPSAA